jgi:hypothetical protein
VLHGMMQALTVVLDQMHLANSCMTQHLIKVTEIIILGCLPIQNNKNAQISWYNIRTQMVQTINIITKEVASLLRNMEILYETKQDCWDISGVLITF